MQVSYLAALILVLGTLMPWVTYGFEGESDLESASLGIESVPGAILVAIAAGAVFLLTRLASARTGRDSGALAALGLLAVGVAGAAGLHTYLDDDTSVAYGLYISDAASLALLAGGILIFGGRPFASEGAGGAGAPGQIEP